PENMEELSNRELQILKELAQGSSPSEIAALLLVSISTIRFHIRGIYQKLEVNNRLQMLRKAEDLGILE
ncbi:MAG TPA: helix-turn-helix transcriptional regulator, partial [Leptospiraceae bacterium]|nr:helix-turn-helix transcriptional regulator [Leptospiraceae bacterium]